MSLLLVLAAAVLFAAAAHCQTDTYANCDRTFSCGAIANVTFPFSGGDRPFYCGLPEFSLTCRDGGVTEMVHDSVAYRVLRLDQAQKSLALARSDLYNNSCPSEFRNITLNPALFSYNTPQNEDVSMFYGCNTSLFNSAANASRELSFPRDNSFSCNSTLFNFSDALYWIGPVPSDPILRIISCNIGLRVPMLKAAGDRLSDSEMSLGEALMEGFDVSYTVQQERLCAECNRLGGQCGFNAETEELLCICGEMPCPFEVTLPPAPSPEANVEGKKRTKEIIFTIVSVSIGSALALAITICCLLKRRHSQNDATRKCNRYVENLLLQHRSLAPKRYKYSEIKNMTKSLSNKLGEGGFGSVYKGTLPDGQPVAVKILSDVDTDGEEFINEVASISKTSHVNIVTLFGFCYEGKRRALVYGYMANKSLDKFLGSNGDCVLDTKKLYEIAVGTAKGLEYLHIGCTTRIVHFDIKPQNILLDQDFCPKISDFGLAKLCRKKQSVLSNLGMRGTYGYIAPEVFLGHYGGASHKSDVYSFGMMLIKMVGGDKIVGTEVERSGENYFPDNIYEQVVTDVTNESDETEIRGEERTRRKMLLVGFWCIQTIPAERPSISKVVEMLERNLDSIQIPPKPFLFSTVVPDHQPSSSSFSVNVETD